MEILKASALTREYLNSDQNGIPVIICTDAGRVIKRIEEAGYQSISVNVRLSKALLSFPPDERPQRVESCFRMVLETHSMLFIKDFEMLFDPRYEIDVIKLFCNKARTTNVAVKWPGSYINGKLTYAHSGDPDYHEYNCNAYQMRIVQ